MHKLGTVGGGAALLSVAFFALGPVTRADGATRVLRPHATDRQGWVEYRLRHVRPRAIVRAVLVRGSWRKRLRLARVRGAARRGRLVVRARPGVRQRLRIVTDTRRPRTMIFSGPSGTGTSQDARFRFGANERSRFMCRLDAGAWAACRSPLSYAGLEDGPHRFAVRAHDRAGNRDLTAAVRRWRIRTGSGGGAGRPDDAGPSTSDDPERPEDTGPDLPLPPGPVSVEPPPLPDALSGDALLADSFSGPDGVITNHYAYWQPQDPSAFRSPIWEMESGCALRRSQTLWTGVPTSNIPNRDCSNGSGSEVFRFWTRRTDFGDVSVTFQLRNNGFTAGSEVNPVRSWDGIKVYLRRQSRLHLYTAEVNRRQGNVLIQKKCPADGGTYYLLSQVRLETTPAQVGTWEAVGGTALNLPGGGVRLQVLRQGVPVLDAIDTGTGCAPIAVPGQVGIRADNTDFNADDFEVAPALP